MAGRKQNREIDRRGMTKPPESDTPPEPGADTGPARAEGRTGGRRKKLDAAKRHEIAESVITGRKSGADTARLYNISQPIVSRIVAEHRMPQP
jgi:hypothetical protein